MRGRSDKSRWFALWSKEWADCVQWVHEICSMIVECGCMRNNNSSSNGMSIRPCQGVVISFWMVAAVWRTRDKSMFLMKIASGTVHVWAWFVNTCVILKCVCYRACLRKKKTNQDVIQYLTVLLDTYGPIVLVHLTCDICQFSAICFGFVALHLTCFYGQELLIWVGWTCIILMQIGVLQIWMKQKQNFVHRSSAWDNWWVRDGLLWAPCGAVLRDLTMQHALEIFGRLYIPRENNSVYG